MTHFSTFARFPVTKTAPSSSDNRRPEPMMRNPLTVTSSAEMVTTLPEPLPRISALGPPISVSGFLMMIGPA